MTWTGQGQAAAPHLHDPICFSASSSTRQGEINIKKKEQEEIL